MPRVLVADDEEEIVELLSTLISKLGRYTIITAKDGIVSYRKSRNQRFDIICVISAC